MKTPHKHKLHQQYFLKDGTEVPGGSTIAGLLDKGMGMVGSAVKLTKAGLDYKEVWNEKRDAGSLLHERILHDLTGKPFETGAYTQNMIERSDNSMVKYYDWKKKHTIEVMYAEKELISEEMRVGGTVDLIARIDGLVTLADYKSGGLYESAHIQAAGYATIAVENKIIIDRIMLLNVPQTDTATFLDPVLTNKERQIYTRIFKYLCNIYWDRASLKYGGKE